MQSLLFEHLRRDDDDCNATIEGDRAVPSVSVNDEELSKTQHASQQQTMWVREWRLFAKVFRCCLQA